MKRTTSTRGVRFTGLGAAMLACAVLVGCAGVDTAGGSSTVLSADGSTEQPTDETMATSSTTSDADTTGEEQSDMDDAPRNVKPKINATEIDPLEAGATGKGLPEGVEGSTSSPAGAAWSPEPGLIYVVTNGSSSCPIIAEVTATEEAGEVVVGLLPKKDGICTMDWGPTTSVVEVPDGVEDGAEVTVRLGDHEALTLPARETDGAPGPIEWVAS